MHPLSFVPRRGLRALGWLALLGLLPPSARAANQPPAFLPATNRHVLNAGGFLAVTNAATDPDLPAQVLGFSLLQAPAGAVVGAASGVVTWTPGTNQAGTSNLFRVVVTDNGSPALAATNSFTVFVRSSRPNVVVVVTDDHGYGDLGAHGGLAATPNFDRLGSDGIRLGRFYATPVCSVTRATLLTGRHPLRTQVNNTRGLDLGEHTLAQAFKAAGYQTYMCGKWHLGGLYNTRSNVVVNGVTQPVVREGVEYQPQNRGWDVHYGEYTGAINYLTHVSQETLQADWWLNGQPNTDAGWSTDLLADKAVQLLETRDPSRPAVLYLAFNAVHGPVSAPASYLNKYASVPEANRRATLAALDHMDTALGRVLQAIDREGIASNTVVAFFGDNGGQASTGGSNLPLRGDKGEFYDGGIHTPAAIRWPGVLPSGITNCQQFVWVGDLFPTLCAAAGIPALNPKPFDGVNVWPFLLAATNGPFHPAASRPFPLLSGSSAGNGIFGLVTNAGQPTVYKLVRERLPGGGGGGGFTNLGLFDILQDPYETTDLLADPAQASVVSALVASQDAIRPETYSPYLSTHPQSQSVPAGASVTFWAMATVYPRQVTFQWRRNGLPLAGATNRVLVDTSVYLSRLDLANVTAADAGVYDLVVTDNATAWPPSVTSLPALLTVSGGPPPAPGVDIVLGRPTDTSVALSLLATNPLEAYLEYGGQPGVYTNQTPLLALAPGAPAVTALSRLAPNQRYYYRARLSATGGAPFLPGPERTFHTQRARGSTFTFVIEADPHHRDNEPDVWRLALANMLADAPDFLVDLGDTFMDEKVGLTNSYYLTRPGIFDLHREVRTGFFNLIAHSVPLFLINGNHEAELGWLLNGTNNPGVWASEARRHYFPVPVPGGFYTGATNSDPYTLGPRDGYYAFEWGDVLIVALDAFWYTTAKPQQNGWGWTLGLPQYQWLKRTLERSTARFKFVFAHHLIGGGGGQEARGGLTYARFFEWGGFNTNGTYGFTTQRPGWPTPIQDLLLANGVQVFFHGHDHLYVKENYDANGDGIPELVYQEVPQPSRTLLSTNAAASYGYTNGPVLPNSGHLRVTVSPTNTRVEYVRVFLPANEGAGRTNRMISASYDLPPAPRWSMSRLPDTAQSSTYASPVPGTDAEYSIHPPAWQDNGDGTATDLVTGLVWQRVDGGEMTYSNAVLYAATNTLGGVPAGTWRLPSIHELSSLLVYNRENPALDPAQFASGAGGNAEYWWSRDRLVTDPTRVWCANAGGGLGPKLPAETLSAGGLFRFHTRLVRGPLPPSVSPIHRFLDHGNGTVTDLDTGLMWQQAGPATAMTWTNALLHAGNLVLGGFADWRVPNLKELHSINDETLANPSVSTAFFPDARPARYWSSTTQNNRTTNAWFAEFISGLTSQAPKVGSNWVRAVRGPGAVAAPVLTPVPAAPGAALRLAVQGDAGRLYTLQGSADLQSWTTLLTTNPPVTPLFWSDPSPGAGSRFYRVLLEP